MLDGLLDRLGDEGRILSDMLESLLYDSVQRGVIVKAKVAGMDDVVGSCLLREFVERSKVSFCLVSATGPVRFAGWASPTSNVCDAENSDGAGLDNAALVRQERRCAGLSKASGTVLEIARVVVRSRLRGVSHVACSLEPHPRRSEIARDEGRCHGEGGCLCKRQLARARRRAAGWERRGQDLTCAR